MALEPVFRPFRTDDTNKICEIAVKAWEPIYDAYRQDMGDKFFNHLYGNWQDVKRKQIEEKSQKSPEEIYVSELDGIIVGFTSFYLDMDKMIGVIGNNAVAPEYQGHGIGQMQHRQVLEIFKQKGMLYATVTTGLDDGHAKARKSYERAGFKRMTWNISYFQEL